MSAEPMLTQELRPAEGAVTRRSERYFAGLLLAACAVYLYASVFADPRTAFLLGGDQVFFWMRAQQMLFGQQIYRDFLEYTPPGTDLAYLGAFRLFGPRIWVLNVIVLLIGVGLAWLCFCIARTIMRRAQAALAAALVVVLIYGRLLQGTHHLFSLLAVLAAVAVLMKSRTPARLAAAGILLGVATFFTQTRGPVAAAAIAACMLWDGFRTAEAWPSQVRRQALLLGPMLVIWLLLSSYYLVTIGWRTLWFYQVTYVRQYAIDSWTLIATGWPHVLSLGTLSAAFQAVFAYLVLPAVYAICLAWCWRSKPSEESSRVALVTAVGTALFVEIALSPNWFRFYCVAAPAVILLVYLAGRAGKWSVPAVRLLWAGILIVGVGQVRGQHVHQPVKLDVPGGRIAVFPAAAEKLAWLASHTRPGQFVVQAGWPGVYLPLAVRNPLFIDDLQSGTQDRRGWLTLSMRQLQEKRVEYVLWSPQLQSPEEGLAPFYRFLQEHYRRVQTFSDADEIWALDR